MNCQLDTLWDGAPYLPTMLSSTLLLPLLCEPTTTIWGRSSGATPTALNTSCTAVTEVGYGQSSRNSRQEKAQARRPQAPPQMRSSPPPHTH